MNRFDAAAIVASVLFALAALHIIWAARGRSPSAVIPSRSDGTPLFQPGPILTLLVALALTTAGLIVLARGGVVPSILGMRFTHTATWVVCSAFALRAIGDFRYVGLFKRERSSRFAMWDTRLFTPLCIALAASIAALATNEIR